MEQPLKILVIHGPNLNMLGSREPQVYGSSTLEEIDNRLKQTGNGLNAVVHTFQSNHEGDIVDKIQAAMHEFDGLIINPAAYTHTSIAIRDALLLLNMPVIEVHLTDIYQRESFRHVSMISDIVKKTVAGLGEKGYREALQSLIDLIRGKKKI
jgi:3-dehydroquinate dehydratase-2